MIEGFTETLYMRKEAEEEYIPIIVNEVLVELIGALKEVNPKRILEVGTATGYSGILMLLNSDKDTILDTIEVDETRVQRAYENFEKFQLASRVEIYKEDAAAALLKLSKNNYDFVFLDGPKSHYLKYFKIIEQSLNKGGIIFADDILFMGYVESNEEVRRKYRKIANKLREFIEYIQNNKDFETRIIKKGQGIAISRKI